MQEINRRLEADTAQLDAKYDEEDAKIKGEIETMKGMRKRNLDQLNDLRVKKKDCMEDKSEALTNHKNLESDHGKY